MGTYKITIDFYTMREINDWAAAQKELDKLTRMDITEDEKKYRSRLETLERRKASAVMAIISSQLENIPF